MVKYNILLIFSLISVMLHAQDGKRIISYDLKTGIADTLDHVDFDEDIVSDYTDFNIGRYSSIFNLLDTNIPEEHLCGQSQFTYKQPASDYYNLNEFPIRTSVTFFIQKEGQLRQKCSGSIVSAKHVLTAFHCVANTVEKKVVLDSLFVCPAYNNGEYNEDFQCSWVDKIHTLGTYSLSPDFALLELADPIGEKTGWLGIGFTKNNEMLENKIFYKFSYPVRTEPIIDLREYNGDTLYFNYGIIDFKKNFNDKQLSIPGFSCGGIPGESGSSIIMVENNQKYISYGVLSYSFGLNHNRITAPSFYALKPVLEPYLHLSTNIPALSSESVVLYPNPTTDKVKFQLPALDNIQIQLFDLSGRRLLHKQVDNCLEGEIDLCSFPADTYLLLITSEKNRFVSKVIKK